MNKPSLFHCFCLHSFCLHGLLHGRVCRGCIIVCSRFLHQPLFRRRTARAQVKSLLETLRTRNKRLASESIAGFNTDTTCQTMSTPCQLAKKTIETTTKSYNAKITQPTSITLPADNLPVRQINQKDGQQT